MPHVVGIVGPGTTEAIAAHASGHNRTGVRARAAAYEHTTPHALATATHCTSHSLSQQAGSSAPTLASIAATSQP